MIWSQIFTIILGTVIYFHNDVMALSTFGREFSGGVIAHPDHFQESIFSIFTYNYDVKVEMQHLIHSLVTVDFHEDVTYFKPVKNLIDVERHQPVEIRIVLNRPDYAANSTETHILELKGNDDFGVSVLYIGKDSATSMYTLLPLKAQGTLYNIYFLKSKQSILMQGAKEGLSLLYHRYQSRSNKLECHSTKLSVNVYKNIVLNSCQLSEVIGRESIRGKLFISKELMTIIVSNCYSESDINKDCELTSDSAMDVLLPRKFAAKEYIAFDVGADTNDEAHVAVMGLFDGTQVKIYSTEFDFEEFTLHAESYKEVVLKNREFQFITASKMIQVYLVTQSTCKEDGGSPSLTMLIPNLLFFNRYIWSIPYNKTYCNQHFLIIIKKSSSDYNFIYDNAKINISPWTKVKGLPRMSGTHHSIDPSGDLHTLVSGVNQPFALYLYGRGIGRSYLHFAGFMVVRLETYLVKVTYSADCLKNITIKERTCEISDMTPGDLIDNDCDGRIDEESSTKSDDDDDGKIGEDVISNVPEYFSRFTQPATKPPPAVVKSATTEFDNTDEKTTQAPKESSQLSLLLLILLMIPVVSAMLYYFLRKKAAPPGVGEELEVPSQSRELQSFGIAEEQQATGEPPTTGEKPQKAFASPGRTKSTYLH